MRHDPEEKATVDQPRRRWIGMPLAVGAVVLCCALPLLIAAGAVTAIGSALGNPAVIAGGAILLATAVGYAMYRRTRAAGCCVPEADAEIRMTPDAPASRPTQSRASRPDTRDRSRSLLRNGRHRATR